jgi:hypothetical protein
LNECSYQRVFSTAATGSASIIILFALFARRIAISRKSGHH